MQVISSNNHLFLNCPYNAAMQRGRKPKKEAPLFGKQLAHFRKKRGLTQYEFADELGISRNLVLHYERSCKNPTMDFIIKASQTLNVSVDELLGLKKEKKEKPGPTPRLARLTKRISTLTKTKQSFVLEMLESYLEKAS